MNEIERVIRLYEDAAQCPCDTYSQIILQALREKAERDKGCEYCEADAHGEYLAREFYCNQNGERINVMFCEGHAFVTITDKSGNERTMSTPIYFCPMCGRKLEAMT